MKIVKIDSVIQFIDGIEINGISGVGNPCRVHILSEDLPKLKPYVDKIIKAKMEEKLFYSKEKSDRVISHYQGKKK